MRVPIEPMPGPTPGRSGPGAQARRPASASVIAALGFSVRTESAGESLLVHGGHHSPTLSLQVTRLNRYFSTVFSRAGMVLDQRAVEGVRRPPGASRN